MFDSWSWSLFQVKKISDANNTTGVASLWHELVFCLVSDERSYRCNIAHRCLEFRWLLRKNTGPILFVGSFSGLLLAASVRTCDFTQRCTWNSFSLIFCVCVWRCRCMNVLCHPRQLHSRSSVIMTIPLLSSALQRLNEHYQRRVRILLRAITRELQSQSINLASIYGLRGWWGLWVGYPQDTDVAEIPPRKGQNVFLVTCLIRVQWWRENCRNNKLAISFHRGPSAVFHVRLKRWKQLSPVSFAFRRTARAKHLTSDDGSLSYQDSSLSKKNESQAHL